MARQKSAEEIQVVEEVQRAADAAMAEVVDFM